ncbi:MAG TPA: serine hydrolase domain-containing protein [Vicinamibacterales bacterium]
MAKNRTQIWIAVIALPFGALFAFILGLYGYVRATATPIHPDPKEVPSVIHSAPPPKWTGVVDQARQIVRAGLAEQNLPGLSVAVGTGGDLVWAEGFGWADLENHVRVTPDTRFRIGNVSNTLTSAAVGLLLEKHRLTLDADIQMYVPDFPEKQWPVTLRQLMAQLAGVRNDAGDEEPLSERCERTVDGLKRFADRPLLFEPGTRFRSSSYGWILVSAAVEAAAKKPFDTFMRARIFEPLGMAATRADVASERIADRATFYFPRFGGETRYGPELARVGDYSCFAGAGAFLSTPSDMVRFGMAVGGGTLLQSATVEVLQTPQRLTSGEPTGYGLGWTLETVPLAGQPTRMAGHGTKRDFIGGTATLMTFPDRGLVVAVMSNTSFADTSSLALGIAQAFAEQTGGRTRK